jgi:acetolactate decarboxylase
MPSINDKALLFLAAFVCVCCPCAGIDDSDILFQVSTIDALMQGVYDGFFTFDELMDHGDFGIGTFDSLEGEMVALDGEYYQVKSDGVAYPVGGNMTTPFSTVTFFQADKVASIHNASNMTELSRQIDGELDSANVFYALRIDGTFSYVKTRSVPRQEKPYLRLVDAVKNQSVFEMENVAGTVVGVWAPQFSEGLNVPGYHLHFITADRKAGGHILDIAIDEGEMLLDITSGFAMQLPEEGDFYSVDLSGDLQSELEEIEK